jgi:gamma-butyrobetaine dioxygenase
MNPVTRYERIEAPLERVTPSLRAALQSHGIAIMHAGLHAEQIVREPWRFVQQLFGERPALIERQPIRPIPGGRSFASSMAAAPFHTDSQQYRGLPPHAQLMYCIRPADRGGQSTFIDSWALVSRIEQKQPDLARAVFETARRMPFVFGDVYGPTFGLRQKSLVFTHSAMPQPNDPVASALDRFIASEPPLELAIKTGELLVIDNHRVLHGRRPFNDSSREFVRLLVWLSAPLGDHPRYRARAEAVAQLHHGQLSTHSLDVQERFGMVEPRSDRAMHQWSVVMEMLRGVPPGVIAAREKIAEPELYRWRNAALTAALTGLEDLDRKPEPAEDMLMAMVTALNTRR